jgi:hypothetical protein
MTEHQLPNAQPPSDVDVHARLDTIQRGYERWTRYTIRLLAGLVVFQLALGALSIYLLGQNSERAAEAAEQRAQIQQSRFNAVAQACTDQNARNAAAKREIAAADLDLEARELALTIVDALAPQVPDCESHAARVTNVNP